MLNRASFLFVALAAGCACPEPPAATPAAPVVAPVPTACENKESGTAPDKSAEGVADSTALTMDLPSARSSEDLQATLRVEMYADGRVQLDGRPVNDAELQSAAATACAAPGRRVLILADKNVKHGDVIHTIDVMKSNGCAKFAFAVAVGGS